MKDQSEKFIEFLEEDDGRLLELMIDNLSDAELSCFLKNNPDFIEELVK